MPLRRIYLLTTALLVALFSLVGIFSTTYFVATAVLDTPTIVSVQEQTASDISTTTPYKPSQALVELNAKLLADGKCWITTTPDVDDYQTALQDGRVAKDGFIAPDMPIRLEVSCDSDHIVVTGSVEQILSGEAPELELKGSEASLSLVYHFNSAFGDNLELTKDYNGDGYNDLSSMVMTGSQVTTKVYFLFDPKSKLFFPHKELSSFENLSVRKEAVLESTHWSMGSYSMNEYFWKGDSILPRYSISCNDYSWDNKSTIPDGKTEVKKWFYDSNGELASTSRAIKESCY